MVDADGAHGIDQRAQATVKYAVSGDDCPHRQNPFVKKRLEQAGYG